MKNSKTGNIAVLLVFCLLALCLLMTLLMGAGVYRNLTERGEEIYARRTVSRYVSSHVRQADAVSVEDFAGIQPLTMRETVQGTVYLTRIYCYEGWLRELFTAEGSSLTPADGEQLIPAEEMSFLLENRLLTVCADDQTFVLYLRGREVLP